MQLVDNLLSFIFQQHWWPCCYESKATEARQVMSNMQSISICCSTLCLLVRKHKKFTLTGLVILATAWLVSLVASPLVDSGSKWSCILLLKHLCLKVSPCRSFCSQKPRARHGVGPLLAAQNKDLTKGRTVAPNSQTSWVLCTSGKLKG